MSENGRPGQAGGAGAGPKQKTNERSHSTNSRQKSQTKFTFSAQDVKKALDKAAFYAGEIGISLPPAKADGWTENLPCPFHEETVGSFGVNILDGRFHCFGCQAKGDVFDFYQRRRGCDFQTAFQELAKLAGLHTAGSQKKADPDRKKRIFRNQVAEYLYTNADGQPVMLVRKFVDPLDPSDKIFLQYRPDGQDGWIAGVKGHINRLIPYRLPEVIKADVVFIAEGEKDCDTLAAAGLPASCNPGGAGKWPEYFCRYLVMKDVIVLPDNDDPGRDHAELVARNLAGHAKSIKIIHLPDLPPKGDVSDFFKNNSKPKEKLLQLVDAAQQWEPSADDQAQGDDWPEPLPLTQTYDPEPFPMEALPGILLDAVEEVAGYSQAPVPMIISSALGAMSAAIQGHVDVERDNGLTGPVSLSLWVVASSGERKSTVDKFFIDPIKRFEDEKLKEMLPELRQFEIDLKVYKSKESGILDAIRAAKKDRSKGIDTQALETELACLEPPKRPLVPVIQRGDDTPEALGHDLAHGWPSVYIESAEAGSIFGAHGMSQQVIMRNLAFHNTLWDGGVLRIGRRTSDSYKIDDVRASTCLMIQYEALRLFVQESKGLARGTGYLARPLPCKPQSTQGTRFYKSPPTGWPSLNKFNRRIRELLEFPLHLDDDGHVHPRMLPLSQAAKTSWIDYYNRIEALLAVGNEYADFADIASKSADNAARIAAILQIFDDLHARNVGAEYMKAGCLIAEWYLGEARRLWSDVSASDELSQAQKLDAWLISYCRENKAEAVDRSHAMQYGPTCIRSKKKLDAALEDLAELYRIRVVEQNRKKIIELNPALLAKRKTAKNAKTENNESQEKPNFSNFSDFAVSGTPEPENFDDEVDHEPIQETADCLIF